ncbi:hypothetical protein BASA83_002196 [Batrachochytrium salamandrivorans]|nr:hypothetical protein BASA83_002196 [Batrachochytrium salamandrivorans]
MNKRDLFNTLMELSDDDKRGECVRHALAVRSALTSSNYHALFGLYHDAPKMSGYLMDHFMERERQKTLCSILKAFRPSVGLEYLAVVLGFVPKHLVDCVMLPLLPTSESSCTSGLSSPLLPIQKLDIDASTPSVPSDVNRGLSESLLPTVTAAAVASSTSAPTLPTALATVSTTTSAAGVSSTAASTGINSLSTLHSSSGISPADRKTIVDAIDAAEVWLDSMNVVWVAPSKPCAPVPDQISKPKSTARSLRQSVASTTKHTVPSSLKYVDCKASAVVVADRAKATFAKVWISRDRFIETIRTWCYYFGSAITASCCCCLLRT